MARTQCAGRRRADEHRVELPPRAPADSAALPLRRHQWRRPAERRPAQCVGLVLLPGDLVPEIKRMWDTGDKIAQGAAMMTDTSVSMRVLGSAWPIHTNKTLAETHQANIKSVGLPKWSEADVTLAKATQRDNRSIAPALAEQCGYPQDFQRGSFERLIWIKAALLLLHHPAERRMAPVLHLDPAIEPAAAVCGSPSGRFWRASTNNWRPITSAFLTWALLAFAWLRAARLSDTTGGSKWALDRRHPPMR